MAIKPHSTPRDKPGKPPSVAQDVTELSLRLDPHNANRHTDASLQAVERSFAKLGAGRSIVVDASDTVVAGEASLKAAESLGLRKRVIDTDGSELLVVRRMDLQPGDPRRTALALADNQTAKLSDFDEDVLCARLRELGGDQDILDAVGFTDAELLERLGYCNINEARPPELADGDREPFQQMTFTLHDSQAEAVKAAIDKAKAAGGFDNSPNENSNGNALARIAEAYCGQG